MAHPYFAGTTKPRIFAHRGYVSSEHAQRGVAENTLAAFQAAIDAGADYLETDCHVSSDGEVVLIHDPDLTRVAGDPREVSSVSKRELRSIMADRGGLLTLGEFLEEFPTARVNLDVKVKPAGMLAARLLAPHAERVLLAAFSDRCRRRTLEAIADLGGVRPATSAGRSQVIRILTALASRSRKALDLAFSGIDAIQVPERQGRISVLSSRLITAAHNRGIEVHVWTVNDPTRMRTLVDVGVDGVITDRTDLAVLELS